nr:hypothetical protein Iba_chr02aCG8100 [Ipomoea batatas]
MYYGRRRNPQHFHQNAPPGHRSRIVERKVSPVMKKTNEVRPDGEPCAVAECGLQPTEGAGGRLFVGEAGGGRWLRSGGWQGGGSDGGMRSGGGVQLRGRWQKLEVADCGCKADGEVRWLAGCGAEVTVVVRCCEQCVAAKYILHFIGVGAAIELKIKEKKKETILQQGVR